MSTSISSTEVLSTTVTSYSWTGAVNSSASVERVNGTETRRNLSPNPGGRSVTGWTGRWFGGANGQGTYAVMTGQSDGPTPQLTSYVRKTWTQTSAVNNNGNVGFETPSVSGLNAGDVVTFSGYVRLQKPGHRHLRPKLQWAGNADVPMTEYFFDVIPAGVWHRVSVTATVPTGITTVYPVLDIDTNDGGPDIVAGEYFDATGALFEVASQTREYFDGSTTGNSVSRRAITRPLQVLGYESTRAGANVFQDVLGRSTPDVFLFPAAPRRGTLTYLYATEAEAAECERMHAGTAVLTLEDPDLTTIGMNYVLAGNLTRRLDDASRLLWVVAVDYQEVQS